MHLSNSNVFGHMCNLYQRVFSGTCHSVWFVLLAACVVVMSSAWVSISQFSVVFFGTYDGYFKWVSSTRSRNTQTFLDIHYNQPCRYFRFYLHVQRFRDIYLCNWCCHPNGKTFFYNVCLYFSVSIYNVSWCNTFHGDSDETKSQCKITRW